MKSTIGALLATLLGVAMLAVGVAGAAGAFDNDDEDSDPGSSFSRSAEVPGIDTCTAGSDTSSYESFSTTGPGADGLLIVQCEAGERKVLFSGSEMVAERPRVVALWLYRNRRDFELIATTTQEPGDDSPSVAGRVPSNTARFRKWIVTEHRAGQDRPEKPGKKILLQAEI